MAGPGGGIIHFGFRLHDPADIATSVSQSNGLVAQSLVTAIFAQGNLTFFFRDPDGYEVEIWYELPTPIDPPPLASEPE